MAKAEKYLIENYTLHDLFKEEFLNKLKELKGETFPVSVVLVNVLENNGNKQGSPLILNHQSADEVKSKVLHVESPNTDLVERAIEILESKK